MPILLILCSFALCLQGRAQVVFGNVAVSAGLINQTYKANTNHGLGAAWIDANGDDFTDLFCVNGKGKKAHFYLNLGNGAFAIRDDLLPTLPDVEMPGSVFADYDNDGDSDLYIYTDNNTNVLSGLPNGNPEDGPPNLLLKNLWVELGGQFPPSGQPLFQEVAAAAGVDDLPPVPFPSVTGSNYPGYRTISASWLDFDRDGWIDLLVAHWSCANAYKLSNWDRLFRNKGDGTFEDVTIAKGLAAPTDTLQLRPKLVVMGAHLDQDLWPDFYTGYVYCGSNEPFSLHYDRYFRNNGLGSFKDATADSPGISDDAGAAMGFAVSDIENDGDWDLYITDIFGGSADVSPTGNVLYVNSGNGTFQDNSAPTAGIAGDTSWPANFFDCDDDGFEDLFLGVYGASQLNRFWVNNGNGTFTDISASAGVQLPPNRAFGSAISDFDRDGDVDLVVMNGDNKPMALLRNNTANSNHWLGIKLVATESNRSAIGTVLKASAGGKQMMRQVLGGSSAHSQDSLSPHFGLGSATTVDSLEVFWPSGRVSRLSNVAADQFITITEGPQHFDASGMACPGGASYAPSLIVSGEAVPGGSIAIDIASAQGGGLVFFVLGLPQPVPTGLKGCLLNVQLPITVAFAGGISGTANGQGNYHLPVVIPLSAPLVTFALQAFVTSNALPTGTSSTNAVNISILP